MTQGDRHIGTTGTNAIFVVAPDEINYIPADQVITYTHLVVNFWPQKYDPNRVRLTKGSDWIKIHGDITTRTAYITTSKVLWNGALSMEKTHFIGLDIFNLLPGNVHGLS